MGLTSVHSNDLQSNKVKNTKKKQSNGLISIGKSDKKYSLKDLDNAIEHGAINISATENLDDNHKIPVFYERMDIETADDKQEDEDIEMVDIENEQDIAKISNYLHQQRSTDRETVATDERIDENLSSLIPTRLQTVFVVDTNFAISHLNTLEGLRKLGPSYHHVIVIPTMTINELDGLKSSDDSNIAKHARSGNAWIYKNLANLDSSVMGQKLRQKLDPSCTKDNAILDCCLYFKEKLECFVILLSNDKNLCLKALTEEILTVSYTKGMTSNLIAKKAYEENVHRFGSPGPHLSNNEVSDAMDITLENSVPAIKSQGSLTFSEVSNTIFSDITATTILAIDYIMSDEYGEDLEHVGFGSDKLNSLNDCSDCIHKYWIAVFTEYFKGSKIQQKDWKELPNVLTNFPKNKKDLLNFLNFWSDILEHLFLKRNDEENHQLGLHIHKLNNLTNRI